MSLNRKHLHIIQGVWTNICRFVLAIVFIFSGFVKAVDPLGTQYKIQDYIEAFGLAELVPDFIPLLASLGLAIFEFTLGVYFFFGIRRKISSVLSLMLMLFMTPLTLYLAIANPVSDCGCFGDAWVLTNWETFFKNIFLLIAAFTVFKWGNRIVRFVSVQTQWLIVFYTLIFIVVIPLYCLRYLPILDFRPYKIGADIHQGMIIPEDAKPNVYETRFILEKEGVKKEFGLENYPDSSWSFVEAKTELIERGYEPPIHDFSIYNINEDEDITEQVLEDKDYTFLLIAHRIEEASDSNIDLINEIYDYSVENGYAFYCLTSSIDSQIEQWKDKTGAEYPFCLTDDITLKTMIRSNPGLMLLKNGIVINKWSHNDLPDEYILTARLENLEIGQLTTGNTLRTVFYVFLWFVLPLSFFIIIDRLWVRRMISKARNKYKKEKEELDKLEHNEQNNDII